MKLCLSTEIITNRKSLCLETIDLRVSLLRVTLLSTFGNSFNY